MTRLRFVDRKGRTEIEWYFERQKAKSLFVHLYTSSNSEYSTALESSTLPSLLFLATAAPFSNQDTISFRFLQYSIS